MNFIYGILLVIASIYLIKKRAMFGDMFGEAEWMRFIGGTYGMVVFIAIFFFFWGISIMTGTQHIFLLPLTWIIPKGGG